MTQFSISIVDNSMILQGILEDSDNVRERLVTVFKALEEEAKTNEMLSKPDDPEFEEWEKSKAAQDPPEGKIHVNHLVGPAYKSVIVKAEELQLGIGGLDLWMNLVQEELSLVSLRYDQSVLAEILQFAASHYSHSRSVFLCQPESILNKERLWKIAKTCAEKYHLVVEKTSGGKWIGSSLELPFCFSLGKTAQECVDSTMHTTTIGVNLLLSQGRKPPTTG